MSPTVLRAAMAIRGVSSRELARALRVDEVTVWRWRTGKSEIRPKQAEKVARVLYPDAAGGAPRQ